MSEERMLPVWVIYRHPKEYPDGYVARRWACVPQPDQQEPEAASIRVPLISPDIGSLRKALRGMGLRRVEDTRDRDDSVAELWL